MGASFDANKAAINLAKHGVSLAEGEGVLFDPLALTIEDLAASGERRYVTVGANVFGELRVVVWTPRDGTTRIISVRRTEPNERRAYEEGV